jgi:hypothetical protein
MPIKKAVQNIYEKNKSKFDEIDQEREAQEKRRQEYIDKWNKTTGVMNPGEQKFAQVPTILETTPQGLTQLGAFQEQRKSEQEEANKNISILGAPFVGVNKLQDKQAAAFSPVSEPNVLPLAQDIYKYKTELGDKLSGDIGSVTSMFVNTDDFGEGVFNGKSGDLSDEAKMLANKIWASKKFDPSAKDESIKEAVKYMLGDQYMDKINQASTFNLLAENKDIYGAGGNQTFIANSFWNGFSKGTGTMVRGISELPDLALAGAKYLQGDKKAASDIFNASAETISRPFFGSKTGDILETTPSKETQDILNKYGVFRTMNATASSLGAMAPALIATYLTGGASNAALAAGARATAGGVIDAAALEGAEAVGARVASGIATEAAGGYAVTELGAMPALVNNTSKLVNLSGKIGAFAAEKLPSFIASKAKDAALTTLTFGGIQLDGDYQEGLNKGLSGEDLAAYTLKRTATSLAIEAISVPFIPARWIPEGNIVKNILNGEKKQWTKAAFELGEGFFGEGAEEVLDKMKNDYFDSQMEKADYQKQLELYNSGQLQQPPNPPKDYSAWKSFGSTAEDFLVGGISGMLFKAGPAINVLNAPTQGNALYKATQDIQSFNNKVDKMLGEGKLDQDQAKSLKGFVATIQPHVEDAKNKKLEGVRATQWAIESAKLNEAASLMTKPSWIDTASEEDKQEVTNMAYAASANMKMIEKGHWLKDKAVSSDQINEISQFETPANLYTEDQRNFISDVGLFETKTIDLKSGNTVAPKLEDGTFDNTIPQLAQQIKDGSLVFENTTGLPPVLDDSGKVIDGKKRMAKALADGVTKMDVLVPVSQEKIVEQLTDGLNNGVAVTLNTDSIKQYDPETQRTVKDISAQFIQLSQIELDKAKEEDRTAAELKGTAFEAPSNVSQVTRPWYWAINQLMQAGISENEIPKIVAAMVGNNVSEGAIKSFMNTNKKTFSKPNIAKVKTKKEATIATQAQVSTAVGVADQIRDLTNKLDEGGLSKSEAREVKRQITDLKKSDKISNFTKIVNELESKGIAQRLDKNCP